MEKIIGDLVLNFVPLDYPYKDSSNGGNWGEIKLIYTDKVKELNLLCWQWDISETIEWFDRIKKILLTEEFPFFISEEESIAESHERMLDTMSSVEIEHDDYELIEKYYFNHRFYLRGTPTPRFYIGMKKGLGEISFFDEGSRNYRMYNFNLYGFVEQVESLLTSI